jgi:hypothetical protein
MRIPYCDLGSEKVTINEIRTGTFVCPSFGGTSGQIPLGLFFVSSFKNRGSDPIAGGFFINNFYRIQSASGSTFDLWISAALPTKPSLMLYRFFRWTLGYLLCFQSSNRYNHRSIAFPCCNGRPNCLWFHFFSELDFGCQLSLSHAASS